MQNFKRMIAIVLSFSLLMSSFIVAEAEESTAASKLNKLGLLSEVSSSQLGAKLSREIGITMILKSLGYTQAQADIEMATSPFTDVTGWSAGWAALAAKVGITMGVTANTFDPLAPLTEQQFVAFQLRALGYDKTDAYVNAKVLGLSAGLITAGNSLDSKTYTKGQAAEVMFAALSAYVQGTSPSVKLIDQLIVNKVVTDAAAVLVGLKSPALMKSVQAIDATTIIITFDRAIVAMASDYYILDKSNKEVIVNAATSVDSGNGVVLKVAEMSVGSKYAVNYNGSSKDVVPTIKNDESKPTIASATAVTGTIVRAIFTTRNINKDTLVPANFSLDNDARINSVKLDTAMMEKDDQQGNTVILLDVTGLKAGKAFVLKANAIASYEGAASSSSSATFAGKDADATAPKISYAKTIGGYKVELKFDEAGIVNDTALDIYNYSITPTIEVKSVKWEKNELGNNIVLLTTADLKAGIAYTIRVDRISDGTNTMREALSYTFAGIDRAKNQELVSAISTDSTKVLVTFKYEANDTALISGYYTINNDINVRSAEFKEDNSVDGVDKTKVILTTSNMKAGIAYKMTVSSGVQDELGQGLKDSASYTFAGRDPDTTFGSVSAVSADKNTITVTFSEEVDRTTATTLVNYYVSDLGYPSSISLDSAGKIATLKVATQTAGKSYTISFSGIKDKAGNVVSSDTKAKFTGKSDITSSLKILKVTALSTTKIKVSFNEKLQASVADHFTLTSTSGTYSLDSPTAIAGSDYVIFTVGTTALSADKVYTLIAGSSSHLLGLNTSHSFGSTSEADRKSIFVGSDSTITTFDVTSITATDRTHVRVVFNSPLSITGTNNQDNAEGGTLRLYTRSDYSGTVLASATGMTLSADRKSVIFTVPAMDDTTVYFAKLSRQYDYTGTTDNFKTSDGAVLVCETNESYKKLTLVTALLSVTSKLDINYAVMIDVNTLEVAFTEDTTQTLDKNAFDVTKASNGNEIATIKYVNWLDARTCRVYFTIPSSELTNTNGIYYLKVVSTPISLVTNTAFTWESDKNVELFAYNNAVNEKPEITLVEPMAAKVISVVTSEQVFKGTTQTSLDLSGAQFIIRDADHNVTLVPDTDYTVVIGTGADANKVFYITLKNGNFLASGNYYIGFADNVYGIDGVVRADIYNPASSETNHGFNFGGVATQATPSAAMFALANHGGDEEKLITVSEFYPSDARTIEIYWDDSSNPTAASAAKAFYDTTGTLPTIAGQSLDISNGISINAGDYVYYRFVDILGQKTAWISDGTALGLLVAEDVEITDYPGVLDDLIKIKSSTNTKELKEGDSLIIKIGGITISYTLSASDVLALKTGSLDKSIDRFSIVSGAANLNEVDSMITPATGAVLYFVNVNAHRTPTISKTVLGGVVNKPVISLVEPLTDKSIKVTTSEKVFKGPTQLAFDLTGAQFVIRNADTDVTLTANTDYTLTLGTGTEANEVFYITLNVATFLLGTNYYIGFADDLIVDGNDTDVYGIDGFTKVDVYVPSANEITNGVHFNGIATQLVPDANVFGVVNHSTNSEKLLTIVPFNSTGIKTIEIYWHKTTVPTNATNALASYTVAGTPITTAGQTFNITDNITILPGSKVYYRFLNTLGQRTAWVLDGVALGQFAAADINMINKPGVADDEIVIASTANTKSFITGDKLVITIGAYSASYILTDEDIVLLKTTDVILDISDFSLLSGDSLEGLDTAIETSKGVSSYFVNATGHRTPQVVENVN